jgi:RNA polymerase sigma-70 factor (ECF subfamily)
LKEKTDINSLEPNAGRIQAFLNLMTANRNGIYGYILCLVPQISDADDILQETTLLMWEKFSDFRLGSDFVAWGMAIARFKAMKFIQKKQRGCCLDEDVISTLAGESETFMRDIDIRIEALHRCIKKLPENDALIIKLRYGQDAAVKAIADRLGRAEKTVYKALGRINTILLHCIRKYLLQEGAL